MLGKQPKRDELIKEQAHHKVSLLPAKYTSVEEVRKTLVNKMLFPIIDPDRKLYRNFRKSYYEGSIAKVIKNYEEGKYNYTAIKNATPMNDRDKEVYLKKFTKAVRSTQAQSPKFKEVNIMSRASIPDLKQSVDIQEQLGDNAKNFTNEKSLGKISSLNNFQKDTTTINTPYKNSDFIKGFRKKRIKKLRVASAKGEDEEQTTLRRCDSTRANCIELEAPKAISSIKYSRSIKQLSDKEITNNRHLDVGQKLKNLKAKHNSLTLVADEYKNYLERKKVKTMGKRSMSKLMDHPAEFRSASRELKKRNVMSQVKQMIMQGKTEKVSKIIKIQFEFVKLRKPKETARPSNKYNEKSGKRLDRFLRKEYKAITQKIMYE
eukprot:TRINITY_DN16429_c0_g1_i1.p1 TRINITY_DN16429_c0_g1~~TRINITY_DN16429_c0_g1_i1.p1  ORF type:complete len:376 (+),score=61.46 TRINITY_DN16429_c0_g1_i1:51-1178(+)